MIITIFQDYTVLGIAYVARHVCCFSESVLLFETYFSCQYCNEGDAK